MAGKSVLRTLREELQNPTVSQERMARYANITLQTSRKAQTGGTIQYSTAQAILQAVNTAPPEQGLSPLQLDDLPLNME